MQLEVGKIYEGKVTGITSFGAFVELGPNTTGMVHISEVASTFVNEIRDYIKEGETVKVKILSIGDGGKISLSIKKAVDASEQNTSSHSLNKDSHNGASNFNNRNNRYNNKNSNNRNFEKKANTSSKADSFEDMLSKFKQHSEEKMSDLKRNMDSKRRGYSRRGGPKV